MPRRFNGTSLLVCGSVAVVATVVGPSMAMGQGSLIPLSPVAQASGAVITRSAGIEFVTIGSAGNAPWMGNGTDGDRAIGRGSVGYEYRIGRFEVTTSEWVEFYNAAYDRPSNDRLPHLLPPSHWGAVGTNAMTPGGQRWRVPAGNENRPVGDISWRMAAMYCNWLHNDKRTDRAAFLDGAYDVSTFSYSGTSFNDQQQHHPGARYWIPTWDEWLKAAHFDPNRSGTDQEGWWTWANARERMPIYGPPGVVQGGMASEANGLWQNTDFPGYNPFVVPLGAYPLTQSPWGLFDTAGATSEWTEEVGFVNGLFPSFRVNEGSPWAIHGSQTADLLAGGQSGEYPSIGIYDFGFRIASSVPSPGVSAPAMVLFITACARRRRPTFLGSASPRLTPS